MKNLLFVIAIMLIAGCSNRSTNGPSSADLSEKDSMVQESNSEFDRDSILNTRILKEINKHSWIYDSLFLDTLENANIYFWTSPDSSILTFEFGPDHYQSRMNDLEHPDYVVEVKYGDSLFIYFPKHTFRSHVRLMADTLWLTYRETLNAYYPEVLSQPKTDKFIRFK